MPSLTKKSRKTVAYFCRFLTKKFINNTQDASIGSYSRIRTDQTKELNLLIVKFYFSFIHSVFLEKIIYQRPFKCIQEKKRYIQYEYTFIFKFFENRDD